MALLHIIMLLFSSSGNQTNPELIIPRKNSVGVYFGLLEGNVNYERNILAFPKSYWNIRTGWGQFTNLQAQGDVYNITLVYILGKRKAHLELNAGVKYLDMKDEKNRFYPDLFAGYRVEKPDGRVFARIGLSGLSIVNIGAGLKF
ncbi:MAG TPA: hypothetical protein VK207_01340 [Bacteroidales bacterium]|nr:hypothetical protein [Bacteroidales bacterium]